MPVTHLPRMPLGDAAPSARVWSALVNELGYAGARFRIERTHAQEEAPSPGPSPSGVDLIVPWSPKVEAYRGDMWTPAFSTMVFIRDPGTYFIYLQIRFAAFGPSAPLGGITYNGSSAGRRWAYIMLNGTSPAAHTIGSSGPVRPVTWVEGMSARAYAVRTLVPGDVIWAGFKHTAGAAITSLNTDFGGTNLTIARLGPGGGL